jgi:4-hydroxy-tetrahydrodipicolinate reductase
VSNPGKPPIVRAVLIGVTGRMGQALLRAAPGLGELLITGAIASPASLALGRDAGEVSGGPRMNLTVESDLARALGQADVALDFSSPLATPSNVRACREARKALLVGTTGFGAEVEAGIEAAARDIPLLVAANTSIGVAVLTELVRSAARRLPPSFDIDVLDFHHRLKPDAPSGTALALGAAAAAARVHGLSPGRAPGPAAPSAAASAASSAAASAASSGLPSAARAGARPEGRIDFASVRAGDVVGEHTVLFSGAGEQLSLTHRAGDRAVFARGALQAALWLVSQPPGRYSMSDFLGFETDT